MENRLMLKRGKPFWRLPGIMVFTFPVSAIMKHWHPRATADSVQ
jgi:hypothetical protein